MTDKIGTTREYRMAGEYRRCVIYVLLGFFLIVPTAYFCNQTLGRPVAELMRFVVFLPPLAILLACTFTWKIVVEETGLSRRRFWFWDFWSWDDFASGEVQKREHYKLYHSSRRWGRRSLDLGWLEQDDRHELLQTINGHYQPLAVDVPDKLQLHNVYRKWHTTLLDQRGITISDGELKKCYQWSEVSLVQVVRYDEVRHDFRNMVLHFSDNECELVPENQVYLSIDQRFRGATSEQVSQYVLSHVDEGKVDLRIVGQRPRLEREIKNELKGAQTNIRFNITLWSVFFILVFATMVWETGLISKGLLFGSLSAGLMMAITIIGDWFDRRRKKALIKELDELSGQPAADER